jgi:dihydroorotase-like cyclic amidohydrolase
MPLLLKSGTLVTAADTFKADMLVEGEKIVAIGANLGIRKHRNRGCLQESSSYLAD